MTDPYETMPSRRIDEIERRLIRNEFSGRLFLTVMTVLLAAVAFFVSRSFDQLDRLVEANHQLALQVARMDTRLAVVEDDLEKRRP